MRARHATAVIRADFTDDRLVYHGLLEAANDLGLSVLGSTKHEFYPQGLTAVVLLSESHISIHTYPEEGYAYVDAFTCGDIDPRRVIGALCRMYNGDYVDMRLEERSRGDDHTDA